MLTMRLITTTVLPHQLRHMLTATTQDRLVSWQTTTQTHTPTKSIRDTQANTRVQLMSLPISTKKTSLTGLPKILLNINKQKKNIPVRARLHRKMCREVMPAIRAVTATPIHRLQDKRHSVSIWTSLQTRYQHSKMKPTRVISNSRKIR